MKLVWSARSLDDRREIYTYIEGENPWAAITVDERIEASAQRLIQFPESGRPGRVEGTRELLVRRAPYILPYRIVGDSVRILRVIHAARLWPDEIPDEG